ncbi:hypothetical protein [Dyadobacter frigoris]|uniref:General stress protein 17M-like domain-containing protein n=1 Tax=Dyadobacter frigoris TaxID=2576211 RepID=A0A4U6D832_9BACT|nr:hypothetical protein [Dyadobacter frigoris]TKT92397.1 hypothetical protein FDK13_10505 [Dyadobacter frigoris]
MENSDYNPVPDTITSVFQTREGAQKAYDELIYRGYNADDIIVIISGETQALHLSKENHEDHSEHKILEKAGLGTAIGGTAGAVAGAIAAIGTAVIIPGLGIAVAGPILASLTGAGAGGITGGIIGALVGSGISKHYAEHYEKSLKGGGIIIGFKPKTVEDRMEIITAWNGFGGRQVHED